MERVQKLQHSGKEIVVVDYSNCRGDELIEIFEDAKSIVLNEKGQHLVLNVFNEKSYVSGTFMRHLERELPPVDIYISKQAVIGLSPIQQWILKGLNLWYQRQIHSFNSKEQAIEFLVSK